MELQITRRKPEHFNEEERWFEGAGGSEGQAPSQDAMNNLPLKHSHLKGPSLETIIPWSILKHQGS